LELRDADGLALRTPGVLVTLTMAGATHTARTDRHGRAVFSFRSPAAAGVVALTFNSPDAAPLTLNLTVRQR
jgi:hypothetical protein